MTKSATYKSAQTPPPPPPRASPRTPPAARMFTLFIMLAGCQSISPPPARADNPPPVSQLSPDELRSVLADLAHAHEDKRQLAFFVSLPFQGVAKPYDAFY